MPHANKEDKDRYNKKYGASSEQRLRRAERNRARKEWLKKLIQRLGSKSAAKKAMKGKDVHHTDGNKPPSPKIGGKTRLIDSKKNKDWTL